MCLSRSTPGICREIRILLKAGKEKNKKKGSYSMKTRKNLTFLSLTVLVLILTFSAFSQGTEKGEESMVLTRTQGEYTVKTDVTDQVLYLDIPEEKDYYYEEGKIERETPLYHTLEELMSYSDFISASIISAKAKQFDDGLYAAVEMAAQEGAGEFKGKKLLLESIYKSLEDMEKDDMVMATEGFITASSELGGQNFGEGNDKIQEIKEQIKGEFLSNELRSKPIGFYTWNDELSGIFQQDRLLQTPFTDSFQVNTPIPLTEAIINSGQKDIYIKYLELVEKLTNPFTKDLSDLRPLITDPSLYKPGELFALFPPSRAYETDLIKKLYGNSPIPDGFNLADKLIEEIKAGRIDLTPAKNSGWYDYQTYSFEPLVMPEKFPEAKKAEFSESYRKELLELFKSLLALTRETHIKQLEIPTAGCCPPDDSEEPKIDIYVYPELSLEPLATYYLRRARSYDFIHRVLIETFGKEGLMSMHRLTKDGPVELSLEEELKNMEALFYGASLKVCSELGCSLETTTEDGSGKGKNADMEFAAEWLKNVSTDPDIAKDNRMMVPVFYDIGRKMTKVWVFLGYETKTLAVEFKNIPKVKVFDKEGKELEGNRLNLIYENTSEQIIYPVFAEVYVNKILNREEFQALCNKYSTRSEILEALEK